MSKLPESDIKQCLLLRYHKGAPDTGVLFTVNGLWAMASDLSNSSDQILLTCPRLSSVAFIPVCLRLMCERCHF